MHSLIEIDEVVLDKKWRRAWLYELENWHSQLGPSWEERDVRPAHIRINRPQYSKARTWLNWNLTTFRQRCNEWSVHSRARESSAKYFLSPPKIANLRVCSRTDMMPCHHMNFTGMLTNLLSAFLTAGYNPSGDYFKGGIIMHI